MDTSTTMNVMVLIFALMVVDHGSAELGFQGEVQNRTARQMSCLENHEYPHNGFCCRNCEAGTYVKDKCSRNQEKGTCAPCETGTYAEHPTGMEQCLQCSQCHRDQIMVADCTSTSNTKCECKPGTFCLPEEPCEVCKKCTKCKANEEKVSHCTPTSNTKCQIRTSTTEGPTNTPLPSDNTTSITVGITVFLVVIIVCIAFVLFLWKRQQRRQSDTDDTDLKEVKVPIDNCPKSEEERENSRNAGLEQEEGHQPEARPLLTQETQETGSKSMPVEDEDRGLGDSLPNTTSSSQTSLPNLSPGYIENSPRPSPPAPRQKEEDPESWAREDGPVRKLVPLLGEEESLSKSFDLFDALDVRYHNRFFRSIGVNDNAIKVAETQQPMDKVYDLLRVWMQKEGLRANINTLLQALLDLDQRYSAEHIASKAVERGYYKYE